MKCIIPVDITDAILLSSSVAETSSATSTTVIAAYDASTTYNTGDVCTVDHVIYTCLADGTTGIEPSENISATTPVWAQGVYTNRWKMFDKYINTASQTSGADIVVELDSSYCNGVALFGVVGTSAKIEVYASDNTLIFSKELDLLAVQVATWEQFFFSKRRFSPSLWAEFPLRSASTIKVTVSGSAPEVGKLVLGEVQTIGSTMWEPKVTKTDYSIYSTDTFGQIYLSKGKAQRDFDGNVYIKTEDLQSVENAVDNIRATITAFATGNSEDSAGLYNYMLLCGYIKSFEVTIPRLKVQECAIEISGVI